MCYLSKSIMSIYQAWQLKDRVRPISYPLKNYAMLAPSADKSVVRNRDLLDGLVDK